MAPNALSSISLRYGHHVSSILSHCIPGRGFAHISPPISPFIEHEKVSRLNQRNLFPFSLSLPYHHHSLCLANHPREAGELGVAAQGLHQQHSRQSVHGPGDQLAIKYGAQTLSTSMIHIASGEGVKKVLNKALAGNRVTISILGRIRYLFRIPYPNFVSPTHSFCIPWSRRRSRFSLQLSFSFL